MALLLYGSNPLVLLYAVNGMSEAPLIFFLLGTTYAYLAWTRAGGLPALFAMAFLAAGAFLVRYEGLPFAAAGAVALLLAFLSLHDLEPDHLEAVLLTFLVPVVYVTAMWVFFNWVFLGDALYFYRSSYGNLAQTLGFRTGATYLSDIIGSWPQAILYSFLRWTVALPAIVPLVLLAFARAVLRRDLVLLGLLGLAGSMPAFHAYLVYSGSSFGWLRFYMYSIPFAFVLAAYLFDNLGRRRGVAWVLTLLLVAASAPVSGLALARQDIGREEADQVRSLLDRSVPVPISASFETDKEIAAYVDALPPTTLVLMDSALAYGVNVFARQHDRFVITSDRDFPEVLKRPERFVTHVLVPAPNALDAVGGAHPELWQGGAPWAALERDFGGLNRWRLYRVAQR